jgi:hypothetical protein
MALPTVVQHLGVLESAGIVRSDKVGRVRTYQLVPDALAPAIDWLGQQKPPAVRRLDRLGTVPGHGFVLAVPEVASPLLHDVGDGFSARGGRCG